MFFRFLFSSFLFHYQYQRNLLPEKILLRNDLGVEWHVKRGASQIGDKPDR